MKEIALAKSSEGWRSPADIFLKVSSSTVLQICWIWPSGKKHRDQEDLSGSKRRSQVQSFTFLEFANSKDDLPPLLSSDFWISNLYLWLLCFRFPAICLDAVELLIKEVDLHLKANKNKERTFMFARVQDLPRFRAIFLLLCQDKEKDGFPNQQTVLLSSVGFG